MMLKLLLLCAAVAQGFKPSKLVAVTGATGRTGVGVVEELLRRNLGVRCVVRNETKAADVLPAGVEVVTADFEDASSVAAAVAGADACVWAATGLAATPRKTRFGGETAQLIDEIALPAIAGEVGRVVMLSSAGVTRPAWSARKQKRLPQAFDIPIVRLNPAGILGKKARAETLLRRATSDFAVVRPVGLNDDWPRGRPVFAQGDVAVGRTNREDLAAVLVASLESDDVRGKTFEMLTLKGYDAPESLEPAFSRLAARPSRRAVAASYALCQQLLPGTSQDPTKLEMGRKYEEVDAGAVAPREPGAPATDREKAVAAGALGN